MSPTTWKLFQLSVSVNGTKVRVGDKLLVILADRGLAEHRLLFLGHEDRILVVKVGKRLGVFLIRRGDGKRFVACSEEKLTVFLEREAAILHPRKRQSRLH